MEWCPIGDKAGHADHWRIASIAVNLAIVIGQVSLDATAAGIAQYVFDFEEQGASLVGFAVGVVLIGSE